MKNYEDMNLHELTIAAESRVLNDEYLSPWADVLLNYEGESPEKHYHFICTKRSYILVKWAQEVEDRESESWLNVNL